MENFIFCAVKSFTIVNYCNLHHNLRETSTAALDPRHLKVEVAD